MGRLRHGKTKKSGAKGSAKPGLPDAIDLGLISGIDAESEIVTGSTSGNDKELIGDVTKFLEGLKGEDASEPKGKDKQKATDKKKAETNEQKPTPKKQPKHKVAIEQKPKPIELVASSAKTSSKARLVFPATPQWHSLLPSLPPVSTSITSTQLAELQRRAEELHTNDVRAFHGTAEASSSGSETSFLTKIIGSGTLSDRLSALTLLVQSSPVHNIRALETLCGLAERGKGQGGREESLKAMRCIVDWWVGGGINGKLKYFRDQPLLHPDVTDEYLVLWYFEDWLKKWFFKVLHIFETLTGDPLPYVRTQALALVFTLLREKPEQEQNLLRLGVNKLGDSTKQICAKVSHHILTLLQAHPAMKSIVASAISDFVFKPSLSSSIATAPGTSISATGLGTRIVFGDKEDKKPASTKNKAKPRETVGNPHLWYYATITLNQFVLTTSDRDREVAMALVNIYFKMFQGILGAPSPAPTSEMPNEAVDPGQSTVDKQGRVFDRKKKKKKEDKNDGTFFQVDDGDSKLVSALLTGVRRAVGFVGTVDDRLTQHMDTLFRITHTSTFNISLQALVLIQQVVAGLASSLTDDASSKVVDRYYRTLYESLFDPRLAGSNKLAMYLNLFVRSAKSDPSILSTSTSEPSAASKQGRKKTGSDVPQQTVDGQALDRVKALIRRFVQVLVTGGVVGPGASTAPGAGAATEFVAGGLYLLGELFSSVPGLRGLLEAPTESEEDYDPKKREPKYSHAGASPLWELTLLTHHYHPTIALHSRQLLAGESLTGASADLGLNTLMAFLDRFVYKNPKKTKTVDDAVPGGHGTSAMQPAASSRTDGGVRLVKGEVGRDAGERMNALEWRRKGEDAVPADQVFYARYFKTKEDREQRLKAKASRPGEQGDEDGDEAEDQDEKGEESEEDDLEEDDVWAAMQRTMPRMPGDEDEESDIDIDDDSIGEDPDLSSDEGEDRDDEFAEASDNEDLISLSGSLASDIGLIEYDGTDASDGEWDGIEAGSKRKRSGTESNKERRKKLRSLPTFASWDEYAKLIEGEPEDNI